MHPVVVGMRSVGGSSTGASKLGSCRSDMMSVLVGNGVLRPALYPPDWSERTKRETMKERSCDGIVKEGYLKQWCLENKAWGRWSAFGCARTIAYTKPEKRKTHPWFANNLVGNVIQRVTRNWRLSKNGRLDGCVVTAQGSEASERRRIFGLLPGGLLSVSEA